MKKTRCFFFHARSEFGLTKLLTNNPIEISIGIPLLQKRTPLLYRKNIGAFFCCCFGPEYRAAVSRHGDVYTPKPGKGATRSAQAVQPGYKCATKYILSSNVASRILTQICQCIGNFKKKTKKGRHGKTNMKGRREYMFFSEAAHAFDVAMCLFQIIWSSFLSCASAAMLRGQLPVS